MIEQSANGTSCDAVQASEIDFVPSDLAKVNTPETMNINRHQALQDRSQKPLRLLSRESAERCGHWFLCRLQIAYICPKRQGQPKVFVIL
jgi:hypothetical protein